MREWDRQDGGRTEIGEQGKRFLTEGAIMGITSNLALDKFPGIYKNDPS